MNLKALCVLFVCTPFVACRTTSAADESAADESAVKDDSLPAQVSTVAPFFPSYANKRCQLKNERSVACTFEGIAVAGLHDVKASLKIVNGTIIQREGASACSATILGQIDFFAQLRVDGKVSDPNGGGDGQGNVGGTVEINGGNNGIVVDAEAQTYQFSLAANSEQNIEMHGVSVPPIPFNAPSTPAISLYVNGGLVTTTGNCAPWTSDILH